jgi:hypothetical protein
VTREIVHPITRDSIVDSKSREMVQQTVQQYAPHRWTDSASERWRAHTIDGAALRLRRFSVLLLLLLLCLHCISLLPRVSCAIFPLGVSNGYKPASLALVDASANPTLARVESPASLAGSFAYVAAPFTGTMFVDASCAPGAEGCRKRFELKLLNSLDDPSGCAVGRNVTDGGEVIDVGTMLLVQRAGGCFFGTKAQNAETMGAGAVMHHGCDPAPPSNCDGGLTITYSRLDIGIPTPYMQYADALRFRTYLTGRNAWLQAQKIHSSFSGASIPVTTDSSTGASAMFASSSTGVSGGGSSLPACPVCNCSAPLTPSGPAAPSFSDFSEPLVVSFPASGPIVSEEHEALKTIVRNLQAIGKVVDSALNRTGADGWTSLRGWSDLVSSPTLDPCLHRVVGLTCEDGHVVAIWVFGAGGPVFHGPFDQAWGSFPKLRSMELSNNNLQGAVSDALCSLISLQVLGLDRQGDGVRVEVPQGLTSLPECLGNLPIMFLTASTNLITNMPHTLSSANGLQSMVLDHNLLSVLPRNFSTALSGIQSLDMSFNPLLAIAPPSFKGWSNLTDLIVSHCNLTGPIDPDAFDGASSLVQVDMSFNSITGTLPNFVGCDSLVTIALNNNEFGGGIPVEWEQLDTAVNIRLQFNQLSAPMSSLSRMVRAQSIWLNNNRIYTTPVARGDGGALIAAMCPNNIVELNLDWNNITGSWQSGLLAQAKSFKMFSMAHNGLNALPLDMWNIAIERWDVSYNHLNGTLPPNTPLTNSFLNFEGNPGLQGWPLPNWLVQSAQLTSARSDSSFVCRALEHTALRGLRIEVDPSFTNYHGCSCVRGTFGFPPLCEAVPERAAVSPLVGFTSDEVGKDFASMIDTASSGNSVGAQNSTNYDLAHPPGFTDQWYGGQRLTLGVSTTWFVNIQNLFIDTYSTAADNSTANPSSVIGVMPISSSSSIVELLDSGGNTSFIASSSVGGMARFQPVRIITFQFHLSRDLFDSPSDVLFVYEGDPSLSGLRVANIIGTDRFEDPPSLNSSNPDQRASITLTQEYQRRYGAQMNAISNRTLVEVVVFSNAASIHFASRATSGQHFFASQSHDTVCQ